MNTIYLSLENLLIAIVDHCLKKERLRSLFCEPSARQ